MKASALLVALGPLLVPDRAGAAPIVDVAVRGGSVTVPSYDSPIGWLVGVEAHYRVSSTMRVGAYSQYFAAKSLSTAGVYYSFQDHAATRVGVRGELHLRPTATHDPWTAVSAGLFAARERRTSKLGLTPGGLGPDIGIDVGLDLRLGEHVALGALLSVVVPLTTEHAPGVWYSGFDYIPLPLLRMTVSF